MHEAVSDILDLRTRESDGLPRMLVVSLGAHLALLVGLVLLPADWRSARAQGEVEPDVHLPWRRHRPERGRA